MISTRGVLGNIQGIIALTMLTFLFMPSIIFTVPVQNVVLKNFIHGLIYGLSLTIFLPGF